MSLQTRNPLRMLGGNPSSGFPQTSELAMTRGGQVTAALYSGNVVSGGLNVSIVSPGAVIVGSDVLICSGPGRLNSVMIQNLISGTAFTIYDAHAVASGGPIAASGHKHLFTVPGNTVGAFGNSLGGGPAALAVDMPFSSGLCVNTRSGQAVCSLSYTPEVVPAAPAT